MSTTELARINKHLAQLPQNLELSDSEKFGEMAKFLKTLQTDIEAVWSAVELEMKQRGISSIKGDWGHVTLAERVNWKVGADVDPYYLKATADTKKLNAAFAAGEIPNGADFTTTVYATKRINKC